MVVNIASADCSGFIAIVARFPTNCGDPMKNRRRKDISACLTDMQNEILRQAVTDMITVAVVSQRFYLDGSVVAARSAIRRLCDDSYLQSVNLDGQRVYYQLRARGAEAIGLRKTPPPLKRQGKISRYAVSWFIHADQPGKRSLARHDSLIQEFGLTGHSLPNHPFFLDETSDHSKLGIIFVDYNARPWRYVNKILGLLRRFLRHGWFADVIQSHSFIVAILTYSTHRKSQLLKCIPHQLAELGADVFGRVQPNGQPRCPIDLQMHVIPGLKPLIMLPHNDKGDDSSC
jgi:hypothetical protein